MKSKAQFIQIPKYEFIKLSRKPFRRGVLLKGPLVYYSKQLRDCVCVPSGFQSDGASVPKFLWDRMPPFGKYLEAAIVHDFYCTLGRDGRSPIGFRQAAKIFREAMAACGVGWYRRNIMYQAVRWFGPKFKSTGV